MMNVLKETSLKDQIFKVRYTDVLDDEACSFEKALLGAARLRPYDEKRLSIDLPLFQQLVWLKKTSNPVRLLQLSGAAGEPLAQIAAELHRPRSAPWFTHATVTTLGPSYTSPDVLLVGLRELSALLASRDGVKRLRVQSRTLEPADRLDFESITRRLGFRSAEPLGVWRTLLCDLKSSEEELLSSLGKKTRGKLRGNGIESVEIRDISDPKWVPSIRNALDAAFSRTHGGKAFLDLEPLFAISRERPDLVLIEGLFFKHRPDELMAFHIALRHGFVAESLSAGSFADPELRKLPFNYFMIWNQQAWARRNGAKLLDMGGVTDEGVTDPLAGISHFKRRFCDVEVEVGREMELELSPLPCALFDLQSKILGWLRPRLSQ